MENGGKISRDTVPLNIHMLTKSYRFASSTFTRAEKRLQPVTKKQERPKGEKNLEYKLMSDGCQCSLAYYQKGYYRTDMIFYCSTILYGYIFLFFIFSIVHLSRNYLGNIVNI